MDATGVRRLKDWRNRQHELRISQEFDDHTLQSTGADYDRALVPMTHATADIHAAGVFRLPLNEVRRRRTSLRWRLFHFAGVY